MLTSLVKTLWKPAFITVFAARLLFSDPCYAQETGTIDGTVLNQLNNPVIVDVRAEQVEDRNNFFTTTTNETGNYSLFNLPVPVELMSLFGRYNVKNNNLEIYWSTASETNNYGFDIEQLVKNEWKKIGFVKGSGTTDIENFYSFLTRLKESKDYSFRIKQIDFNGDSEYYFLNVNVPKPAKADIGNVFPSGGSIVNAPVMLNEAGIVEYSIFTVSGKEVKHEIKEFNPGYYSLNWDGLNESGLKVATGNYIINIKGKDFNISKVFFYNPNGPVPLTDFIDENSFKSNEIITFNADIEKYRSINKLNKTNASGVLYDIIFSAENIFPDTLTVFAKGDTTINNIVTQVININANVKDNYSNNNLIKENVSEAELTSNNYTAQTDSEGNTILRIPINQNNSYEIKIKKNNFFTRTTTVNGSEDNYTLNEEIVPYPVSVSADTFRAFCEEANFKELWGYTGLKTMFGNPNAQYWISSHHYNDGSRATSEEQEYVKNLIINEIYPYIKEENRPTIYIENPDSIETLPIHQNGVMLVMPVEIGYSVGPNDENKDGIIDWASVYLWKNQWNEIGKSGILEEILSPLIGPNEVSGEFKDPNTGEAISALATMIINPKLTEVDKMLIKICEFYKPKTQIDYILGIE